MIGIEIKESKIKISGFDLYARQITVSDDANSPVLVFLHDALGCAASWRDFPEKLCSKTGLNGLVYDRPGYGKSSPNTAKRETGYLEKEAVNILPKVLGEFGINATILVGHSDGATIALIHEAKFNRSEALISISGHIMVENITREGVAHTAPTLLNGGQLAKLKSYHGDKAEKLVDSWADIWLSKNFEHWNISASLDLIKCPVFIVQGTDDEYATTDHAYLIEKSIGEDAKTVLIEKCGHFPHKEYPEEVMLHIESFIKNRKDKNQ